MDESPEVVSFSKMRKKEFTLQTLAFFNLNLKIKANNGDIYKFRLKSAIKEDYGESSQVICQGFLVELRSKSSKAAILYQKYQIHINEHTASGYLKVIT